MKIVELRTMVVENEPPYRGGRYLLFVELVTDEGIVGLGERITGNTFSGAGRDFPVQEMKSQIALLEEMGRQFIVGEDPFSVEQIWQRVYGSRHDFRHPSLNATPALSAIEIACWDIIGKATNQPIYNLLGGRYHDRLRAYAYMPVPEGRFQANPEMAGEIAVQLVEEGNSACKLDPFPPLYPLPRDISLAEINIARRIFRSIRDAVGDRMEVGIGTHGAAHHLQRHSGGAGDGGVPPVLVRGAGASGERRRDGPRRRAHQHTHRKRGAAGDQVRVRRANREAGRADHTAGRRSVRGHPGVEEDCRHSRGPLCDDRAPHGLRGPSPRRRPCSWTRAHPTS